MPITQSRTVAIIQAGQDHSAALDSICALIREAHMKALSGLLSPQDALDKLIQWARPEMLLQQPAKSKMVLATEEHWFRTHARTNLRTATKMARKRGKEYQPQDQHPVGNLDMNVLSKAQPLDQAPPSAMQLPLTQEAGEIIERRVRNQEFDNRRLREWLTMEPLQVRQLHSILVGSDLRWPHASPKLIEEYERHMRGELEPRDRSWINDKSQWNDPPIERAGGPDTIYDPQNDPLDQLQRPRRATRDSQSSGGET